MINFHAAQVRNHRRNIERYCRLLATYLTDLERQYLHKRIAEEHAELARLKESGATASSCAGGVRILHVADHAAEETPVCAENFVRLI